MSSFIPPSEKIFVIKVSLFHPVKKMFGFDPALYVFRVWLLIPPKKKDCQESRRIQNVFIQVTPHKAALWGGGGGESKFVDELMKPFRENNAVSRDFNYIIRGFPVL